MKKILIGIEARKKLEEGAKLMADCVAVTLGPRGRNVGIQRPWGTNQILHDGVSVAREVDSPDEYVRMGINYIREAAEKTVQACGDATTTTTLLAYKLIERGLKDTSVNPMILAKQLEEATKEVIAELKNIATPVTSQADLEHVATVSSGDAELGRMIGEAWFKLGKNGVVSVDEYSGFNTTLEYTEGMQWESGYSSAWFVTNPSRREAVIRNPYVIVLGRPVTAVQELLPAMTAIKAIDSSTNVVVIGKVSGAAMQFLTDNKHAGNINALVVDVPGIDDRYTNFLSDIAIYTGARLIQEEVGIDKTDFDTAWCGRAKTVIATKELTKMIEGAGSQDVIDAKVEELTELKKTSESVFEREVLEERIAKLTAGAAIIRVGGTTELDTRNRLERVKDAIGATQAAFEEGIVAGGGTAFLQIAHNLWEPSSDNLTEGEIVLFDILQSPFVKLLENAGHDKKEIQSLLDQIEKKSGTPWGYNLTTNQACDMLKAGVIDPAKAIREALENAIAVGTMVLTCEALIAIQDEKTQAPQIV